MDIQDVGEDAARLNDVLALYRAHKKTLGFMPRGAFEEKAAANTLLVAVDDDGSTSGYLLYDLPRRDIAIRHLCIDPSRRGSGIARVMITELKKRHPERIGIVADCRNDYPAHGMWPALDFEPVNEVRGRSSTGLPLTTWLLDFCHPNLFTAGQDQEQRLRIAIDTDVFIDLFEEREGSDGSRGLIADWVVDVAQLVVTKAVAQDINNNSDPEMRTRRRSQLTAFPRADVPGDEFGSAVEQILTAIGHPELNDHDRRDVEHVARAAVARVAYFASRDQNLVRRLSEPAWELFQLKVRTPSEIINDLWNQVAVPYMPALLENTRFELTEPDPTSDDDLFDAFSASGTGERKWEFKSKLARCRADPLHWEIRLLRSSAGDPVALIGRSTRGPKIEVPIFRVAGRNATTIARQMAHMIRSHGISCEASTAVITDDSLSIQIPEELSAEGFVKAGGAWWAVIVREHALARAVALALSALEAIPEEVGVELAMNRLRSGQLSTTDVADLERRFAPLKIAGSPMATYLISIKPHWAEQLFDTELSEGTLFPREDELGVSREHVYYSGAPKGQMEPPARILWYVSIGDGRKGTGAVRATSRIEEVAVGRPLDLHRRFSRLGVYQRADVLSMSARTNKLMAIRFSNTETFSTPVPLVDLREIVRGYGHNVVLQSPTLLPADVFDAVYERGMRESG